MPDCILGFTMTLRTLGTIMSSFKPGLGNKSAATGTLSVPAQSFSGDFQSRSFSTTVNVGRTTEIGEVQLRVNGIDSKWRLSSGGTLIYYRPNFDTATYSVFVHTSFEGSNLRINATIGTITARSTPAFTVETRAFLYTAPF